MGLNTFSTALSGLATNSHGLNVVGNNLANLNTVGYKSSNVTFTDILGQAIAGSNSTSNVGMGARVGAVRADFSQGGFETTNNATDVAIQGSGFFIVGNGDGNFYTRAGNFSTDADGNLVNPTGHQVQGWVRNPVTGAIDTNGPLTGIRIPTTTGFSTPTSEIELAFNLDASAPVGATFSTSVQLYDSLGASHLARIDFVKTTVSAGESRWDFDITVPHNEFDGIPATSTDRLSLISGAVASATPDQGTIVFDSAGEMTSVFTGAAPATLPPPADLALPPTGVTLPDLANGGTLLGSGLNWKFVSDSGNLNATAVASASALTLNHQNGLPPGELDALAIQPDGTVSGILSNGVTLELARLGMAQFRNENGLLSQGSGLYAETAASGEQLLGAPGQGANGRLIGGALELSNVDLAAEFTKIISFQRGYQANARIISTTDQILQETMAIKQ